MASNGHRPGGRRRSGRNRRGPVIYIVAFVALVFMVFPYLYRLLQSLAPWDEVDSRCVTTSDTVVRVAVAALAGYALAVVSFRGGKALNNIILFQMFYPGIILLVPTFLLARQFGLYNGYGAMIVPITRACRFGLILLDLEDPTPVVRRPEPS